MPALWETEAGDPQLQAQPWQFSNSQGPYLKTLKSTGDVA